MGRHFILKLGIARILLLISFSFYSSSVAQDNVEIDGSPIWIQANGFTITEKEFQSAFDISTRATAAKGSILSPAESAIAKVKMLENLVITEMLILRANETDRKKTKKKLEQTVGLYRKTYPNQEQYVSRLRAMGIPSEEVFLAMLWNRLLRESVIERELEPKIHVSKSRIAEYYRNEIVQFLIPETFHVQHIHFANRDPKGNGFSEFILEEKKKLLESLRKRAEEGESFSELALKHSDDGSTKGQGGKFTFQSGKIAPEIESETTRLSLGGLSGVFSTQYGFHILKLNKVIPSRTQELMEVEDVVRGVLKKRAVSRNLPGLIHQLAEAYSIKSTDAVPFPFRMK